MDVIKCGASQCGSCRFYTPVGRRGGDCSQLGVLVRASWKACCFAQGPFQREEAKPEVLSTPYTSELTPIWPATTRLPQQILNDLVSVTEAVDN